jgi:N-acetylglutamate synthase-like GNAT family acetyltransferase
MEDLLSVLYKPEQKWSEQNIRTDITSENKVYYLATQDADIVGVMGISFSDQEAKFGPLVVKQDWKKRKVGSYLLQFAQQLAKKQGKAKIWCYSLALYNVENFYLKNGWKQDRIITNFFDNQDCFVFSKNLGPTTF